MKKIIVAISLFACLHSYAQDTTKVEQYCEMVATQRFMSTKVSIAVDFGEDRRGWRDQRVKDDNGKVEKFNSVVDALNYMGNQGWKMLNAYPISSGNQLVYHYIFKKEYPKTDDTE